MRGRFLPIDEVVPNYTVLVIWVISLPIGFAADVLRTLLRRS